MLKIIDTRLLGDPLCKIEEELKAAAKLVKAGIKLDRVFPDLILLLLSAYQVRSLFSFAFLISDNSR